jgi:hypothetical protein
MVEELGRIQMIENHEWKVGRQISSYSWQNFGRAWWSCFLNFLFGQMMLKWWFFQTWATEFENKRHGWIDWLEQWWSSWAGRRFLGLIYIWMLGCASGSARKGRMA